MAEITAAAVKSLRDRTGAGMMDCKRALEEAGGDEEQAIDLLRKRGAARAAKRAGREATEGSVQLASDDGRAVMVEVVSETDFVARSEPFETFTRRAVEEAERAELPDGEVLEGDAFLERFADGELREELTRLRASVGENVQVSRVVGYQAAGGATLGSYVHFGNKIGVLVEVTGGEEGRAARVARDVAMHIAATNPAGVSADDIPEDVRERERKVLIEQAEDEGKPPEIAEKIVQGRMRKFYEENTLLEQSFVKDPDRKVKELLAEAGGASVRRFVRFEVGE